MKATVIINKYDNIKTDTGDDIYQWMKDLFPINRSIATPGNRQTLNYIKNLIPELTLHQIPSGTDIFDWQIPQEWDVTKAYIDDEDGNRILDFADNNLHILGFSAPMDEWLTKDQLDKILYSLPERPDAIPYITSYYKRRSGFCMADNQRKSLKDCKYHAVIKSKHYDGFLDYGELILPGNSSEEIFITSYICHPSLANNELSGPVILTALARWIAQIPNRHYTYRFLLAPETIGSIAYLSQHLQHLKQYVKAGFILTCIGDDAPPSYVESRLGDCYADKIIDHILKFHDKNYSKFEYLATGGSDDRQYGSPGVDLPMVVVSRSFVDYAAYHTSDDNLTAISVNALSDSLSIMQKTIILLENDKIYQRTGLCEPQLGKRGLYPTISTLDSTSIVNIQQNLLAYSDGNHSLLDIGIRKNISALKFINLVEPLLKYDLIKQI